MFDRVCREHDKHRFTKLTIHGPTVQSSGRTARSRTRPSSAITMTRIRQLEDHVAAFLDAYNFAKPVKTRHGLTPHKAVCKVCRTKQRRTRPMGTFQDKTQHGRRPCSPSLPRKTSRRASAPSSVLKQNNSRYRNGASDTGTHCARGSRQGLPMLDAGIERPDMERYDPDRCRWGHGACHEIVR